MKCFVCGNTKDFTPLFPKFCSAKNYVCNHCGLVFILRDEKQLTQAYYKKDGYFKKSPNLGFRKLFFSKGLFTKLAKERVAEMRKNFPNANLKGKKVLDVGCGYGHILHILKEDYSCEVLGLEPSKEAAKTGEEAFSVPIEPVLLEEFVSDTKFDLVICSHTLEHVDDPATFLDRIRDLLKDDGFLYLEVPNILKPSGGFSLDKFLYDEHLQTFSVYNLDKLLRGCGLHTVSYDDRDFLRFVCVKDGEGGVALPGKAPTEVLNFLKEYQDSYGFAERLRVCSDKLRYLLKAMHYK